MIFNKTYQEEACSHLQDHQLLTNCLHDLDNKLDRLWSIRPTSMLLDWLSCLCIWFSCFCPLLWCSKDWDEFHGCFDLHPQLVLNLIQVWIPEMKYIKLHNCILHFPNDHQISWFQKWRWFANILQNPKCISLKVIH